MINEEEFLKEHPSFKRFSSKEKFKVAIELLYRNNALRDLKKELGLEAEGKRKEKLK